VSSVCPFSLPLEWLPEEGLDILTSIRRWADEEVIPVRRSIDEDWEAHELSHPLLSTLCATSATSGLRGRRSTAVAG
jgi:hypothetical protein